MNKDAGAMARQDKFYGWFVVTALCAVLFINIAFPYHGAGILNAVMAKDLQLDRKTLGLGFTAMMLAGGFLGPVIAWVIGRAGVRRTIFLGSLVLSGAALLMATSVSQGWQYVLVFGSMMALGVQLSTTIPAQTAVTHWFERRRAFALSVMWTAAGLGGFVAAPLMNKVVAMSGGHWRSGWYFISAASIVTGLIAIIFIRNRPADIGQVVDGNRHRSETHALVASASSKTYRTTENWPLREAFWTPANWIIMYCSVLFMLPAVAMVAHGVIHLGELGHPPAQAALGMGLFALANVVGNVLGGYLADNVEPRYVWGSALMMMAAGTVLLVNAATPVDIYLFAIFMGTGTGASVVCRPTLVGNYFGPLSFAGMLGLQAPVVAIAGATGPFLVGLAYDIQGSYAMSFYVLAALVFTGGLMVLFAKPPIRKAAAAEVVA